MTENDVMADEPTKPHDELITLRLPVWAFQGIMNGLEKWAGRAWSDMKITEPIEFVEMPPSWQILEEEGERHLDMATPPTTESEKGE